MTEELKADLRIELNVTCPSCDEFFDLFEYNDGRLNDDGYLIRSTCPDGVWSETHDKFSEDVRCPECNHEIKVRGILW